MKSCLTLLITATAYAFPDGFADAVAEGFAEGFVGDFAEPNFWADDMSADEIYGAMMISSIILVLFSGLAIAGICGHQFDDSDW